MVTIRLPDELRDAIDAVRGDVPRERWVRRVLERATFSKEEAIDRVVGVVERSGAFEATLSETEGAAQPERSDPAPVDSAESVRSATSPRTHRPQRHEFQSGAEWQAAVRAWKAAQ